jgi:type II secretory pathway pseudopilin PulG
MCRGGAGLGHQGNGIMNRVNKNDPPAFTLIELTVVISVIVLAMAISLPTMLSMFRAGADRQAENVFTAMCTAARTTAIRDGKYTCVTGQLGLSTSKVPGVFYLAIFSREPLSGSNNFRLAQGFEPQRLPGDMCLGAVSTGTISGGAGSGFSQSVVDEPNQFACFSVVFSPSGRVVSQIDGASKVQFDPPSGSTNLIFSPDANYGMWDLGLANAPGAGVSAVTLFSYGQYIARGRGNGSGSNDQTTRTGYLNINGQFLPINAYTGQMFPRR